MLYVFEEREPKLLGDNCYIANSATVIGSVIIENHVCILPGAVIRADNVLFILEKGQIYKMALFCILIQAYPCILVKMLLLLIMQCCMVAPLVIALSLQSVRLL